MNLLPVDWLIIAAVMAVMLYGIRMSRRHMRSVADFLAAGRTAGRYAIAVSQGVAMLGAISIVAYLEMNYVAGFCMSWWGMTMNIVMLAITLSGWVIYRFRETRCLTLAEFFERRYSRNFRVFAGLIAFLSGLINFGIFPAVGARFFIYFCGFPHRFDLLGLELPTFPLVMIVLLGCALFFVFNGGQIAVIVTDFIQGTFVNLTFVVVVVFLLVVVDWDQIFTALATAPANASLVDPFRTSHVKDFNFWYFLIGVFGNIYGAMSWQGTQAYNASATSAHEAKMGNALSMWRNLPQTTMLLFVPIIAYTVMHHADFASLAATVNGKLAGVEQEAIQSQLRIPLILVGLLPAGLMGAFAAVMLAAFISTHDTYLHSWGSIFVQDVILPFRQRPLTQRQHLLVLRWAIIGVAIFIFCFSMLFQQSEYIMLFFAITGAIFLGGSGAVIIGGLYWKHGTTSAAWSAMITGSTIAVAGVICLQLDPEFPLNGQVFYAITMATSVLVYVLVSLLGKRQRFDLDRLLRRGSYRVASDHERTESLPARGWRMLGMGKEFTRGDRVIYLATYTWNVTWFLLFVGGTIYSLSHDVPAATWQDFWRVYLYIQLAVAVLVIVWFTIGGLFNIRDMFRRLTAAHRDAADDGVVRE
ncbi:MAG: sodium:solute symporter [bacterium]